MRFLDPRLPDRFWEKCTPEPNSGCWLWTGTTNGIGYGKIATGDDLLAEGVGRMRYTHRVSYEAFVGPIAPGLVIDHLCRTRECCNPAHLEPVTQRENILRGEGASAVNATVTACPAGHLYTPDNIEPSKYGRSCVKCSRQLAKERRQRLVALGVCLDSEAHGPATHGAYCATCAERIRIYKRAWRASRLAASQTVNYAPMEWSPSHHIKRAS